MKFLSKFLLNRKIVFCYIYILLIYIQPSCLDKNFASKFPELKLETTSIKDGNWLGKLIIDSNDFIPFNFSIIDNKVVFTNDQEKIHTSLSQIDSNTYQINMPVFNSSFNFSLINDSMVGFWRNYAKGEDYKMPFNAVYQGDSPYRFKVLNSLPSNFNGKWEVTFAYSDSNEFQALGVFNQEKSALSGTFITETGDYRFLEGAVKKDSLFLSCFDGSHAFLFKAVQKNDELFGEFYSGNHYKESWKAIRNENFKLQNPDSITTITTDNKLTFTFPNLDSLLVTYPSDAFNNKVVIIQIIGTWCPNCMDETVFLSDLYERYNKDGLEIICLAYEKPGSFKDRCKNVKRLIDHSGAKYNFLIAGGSSKKEVERTLPFIKNVLSFPTSIFINKKGQVKKVHSGFYGPGTGDYYEKYKTEIKGLIESLLSEKLNQ